MVGTCCVSVTGCDAKPVEVSRLIRGAPLLGVLGLGTGITGCCLTGDDGLGDGPLAGIVSTWLGDNGLVTLLRGKVETGCIAVGDLGLGETCTGVGDGDLGLGET